AGIRRETPVDVGHERGALLVPRQDELDLVAIRERGVEGERFLPGYAEHMPDALVLEALHEQLRDVQRAASPARRSTRSGVTRPAATSAAVPPRARSRWSARS